MNPQLHKLHQLIESGQPDNIKLAFQLAKGQHISEEHLLDKWLPLLNYFQYDENDPERSLIDLLNTETLSKEATDVNYIPLEISYLRQVKSIYLLNNKIKYLPASIGDFGQLLELDVSGNQLKDIDPNLFKNTSLQYLNLEENEICLLSPLIGQLQDLYELNLSDNQLENIPEEIGGAWRLEILTLRANKINRLPTTIENLKQLIRLDLGKNKLKSFPYFITKIPALEQLFLDGNELKEVPEAIENLRFLRQLDLSDNPISSIPDSLLDLEYLNELRLPGDLPQSERDKIAAKRPNLAVEYWSPKN